VTNLANELVLADGMRIMEKIEVTARGKNY
jgi:hypothetical protein